MYPDKLKEIKHHKMYINDEPTLYDQIYFVKGYIIHVVSMITREDSVISIRYINNKVGMINLIKALSISRLEREYNINEQLLYLVLCEPVTTSDSDTNTQHLLNSNLDSTRHTVDDLTTDVDLQDLQQLSQNGQVEKIGLFLMDKLNNIYTYDGDIRRPVQLSSERKNVDMDKVYICTHNILPIHSNIRLIDKFFE
jgi:hypothetical protein